MRISLQALNFVPTSSQPSEFVLGACQLQCPPCKDARITGHAIDVCAHAAGASRCTLGFARSSGIGWLLVHPDWFWEDSTLLCSGCTTSTQETEWPWVDWRLAPGLQMSPKLTRGVSALSTIPEIARHHFTAPALPCLIKQLVDAGNCR